MEETKESTHSFIQQIFIECLHVLVPHSTPEVGHRAHDGRAGSRPGNVRPEATLVFSHLIEGGDYSGAQAVMGCAPASLVMICWEGI